MEENTSTLRKNVEELYKQSKFEEIISLLKDEVLETKKDAELYVWRGNTWYNKPDYDYNNAITDYTKALEINPNYELALFNRALAYSARKEFVVAIENFDKVIELNQKSSIAYVNRGSVRRKMKEYDRAIEDYTKAIEIDPYDMNTYYNRGLAKKENNLDLEGSKRDFEIYLKLTTDENDIWAKYAKHYIKKIDEINDKELSVITNLIAKIKVTLLSDEDCIIHYTSLSVLKSLIFDCSKFRISEGNFMNDPSEGTELFNFFSNNTSTSNEKGSTCENFSPKPFIGSFVTKDKYDDLNMWRLYGKEKGEEAKGCAITLRMQEFIEYIKNSLSNEKNKEARLDDESDINFYQVAYLNHGSNNFYIPSSDRKSQKLTNLMTELREKVNIYKGGNKTSLEEYLYSIAFLIKSDAYKNENEVRLVVKGIEYEKKYNMDAIPPLVYIELESIEKIVKQITLGPKVDKVYEWASAFHNSYEENAPTIKISHLPYK